MKKHKITILLILGIFIFIGCANKNQSRKIENLKAFTKLYGYVRWFHPSDEAQTIDWDKFACYGSQIVENAPNSTALKDSLLKLFSPIAPSLQIYSKSEDYNLDSVSYIPETGNNIYPVYWQHLGVKLNKTPADIYKSVRVNRINKNDYKKTPAFGKSLNASALKGKTIELEVRVKSENDVNGNVFFEALSTNDYWNLSKSFNPVFFNNSDWETITLQRKVGANDIHLFVGFSTIENSNIFIDNLKLTVKTDEKDSVIYENNFDNFDDFVDDFSNGFFNYKNLPFDVQKISVNLNSDSCYTVEFSEDFKLFSNYLEYDEVINERIHDKIIVSLPLVLQASDYNTYPITPKEKLRKFQNELIYYSTSKKSKDMGSLVITWNVIQHFFPYFEELGISWENELNSLFENYYNGENTYKILQKLTAKLCDGHVYVSNIQNKKYYKVPINWEWVRDKLLINGVYDNSIQLVPGDEVIKINGRKSKLYFAEIEETISAGTKGWSKYNSQAVALFGEKNDTIDLLYENYEGIQKNIQLEYSMLYKDYYSKSVNLIQYKEIENNILYLNLDQISMDKINSLIPTLNNYKGIICDLRGYPNNNFEFLKHLITQKDTVGNWVQTPQITFPDGKMVGYSFPNEDNGMIPKEPHLNVPIVFITDGSAISAAESYLMFVKHYNLGTIIGQPTAGANGMVNAFKLPNGFAVSFTGAKVVNFDGSQHFMVGVLPDIYVEKTVEGIKAEKDEFLIKAIQILKSEINKNKKNAT